MKFLPILKERVWGGNKLVKLYDKEYSGENSIGESWELSGVEDDVSVVANGFLKGNDINDLIEIYMGDLVGDRVYEKYSSEFPILVKLLEINEPLSLQIHPDDQTAIERHNSYGKTECWYIMEASPNARIYLGLNKELTPGEFYEACQNQTIENHLNVITPVKGDLIYIKPGTLHSAKGGIIVAEIQQVSDVTYRVYDWGREHNPKTAREMHLDLAIDCIDYNPLIPESLLYLDGSCETSYFNIKQLNLNKKTKLLVNSQMERSFLIYIATQGEHIFQYKEIKEKLKEGEVILIPHSLGEFSIEGNGKLLEVTCNINIEQSLSNEEYS